MKAYKMNPQIDGSGEVYNYSIPELQGMAKQLCECYDYRPCQACWAEMELERFRDSEFDDFPVDEFSEEMEGK